MRAEARFIQEPSSFRHRQVEVTSDRASPLMLMVTSAVSTLLVERLSELILAFLRADAPATVAG